MAAKAKVSQVVGIDLGTTNCALAAADIVEGSQAAPAPAALPVPQVTHPGTVEKRSLLPSALYLPNAAEFKAGALALPWDAKRDYLVGDLAKSHGALVPSRLVTSAKSWLSFAGADRRAPILPWNAPEDVGRVSPLTASSRYLEHLGEAYEADVGTPLAKQEVVLTVPASFDAIARELTVEAATAAGITATLLEEPQAALYAWLATAGENWRKALKVGDVILVVDVGGGTTDFSLIAVSEQEGQLSLQRVAVGDHLLLGGDNMDLTLAHTLRARLEQQGKKLDNWQFLALTHACRAGKELLFSDATKSSAPVVIPGRGSGLVGGSIRAELTRADVDELLVQGFLPIGPIDQGPRAARRTGFTEINLPYAADPAITRHLAAFLSRQLGALAGVTGLKEPDGRRFLHPTALLFNGGVMKAPALRQRIVETLQTWLKEDNGQPLKVLEANDLDLAVAKGAAYYGLVRKGRGIRIRGGTARAYYVGIESASPAVPGIAPDVTAVCIAPFGMEEGSDAVRLSRDFGLVVGEPASFRFFASSVRRTDTVGTEISGREESLEELPPIEMTLQAPGSEGKVLPVQLESRVTEVGTLALDCAERGGQRRWKIELSVRQPS
jgi:molecular chaperone DnaK (HSP70)